MQNVKVGLALGSGGAKGFAHIGVIEALVEYQIPVHAVAGSSMGSLIGASFAIGTPISNMKALAIHLKRRHWLDFAVPKMGMIQGDRVREVVRLITGDRDIEDATIPLAIVTTDLVSRQKVVFRQGNIAEAVRASVSIPGIFVPVVADGAVYVDGGVLERVPVTDARDMGCDIVIGVDVGMTPVGTVPHSLLDVIMQSLEVMQDRSFRTAKESASVTIVPQVAHIGASQFGRAEEAIQLGYAAAMEQMPTIRKCLADNGVVS